MNLHALLCLCLAALAYGSIYPDDYPCISDSQGIITDHDVTEITGNLDCFKTDAILIDLPNLVRVGGDILIAENSRLNNLSLPKLTMGDVLQINENGELKSVSLPEFTTTASLLYIGANNKLNNVSLPKLTTVQGTLNFTENGQLVHLSLPMVTAIGLVDIKDNKQLENLSLPKLTTIMESLVINKNPNLKAVFLDSLQTVKNGYTWKENGYSRITVYNLDCVTDYVRLPGFYSTVPNAEFIQQSSLLEQECTPSAPCNITSLGCSIDGGTVDCSCRRFSAENITGRIGLDLPSVTTKLLLNYVPIDQASAGFLASTCAAAPLLNEISIVGTTLSYVHKEAFENCTKLNLITSSDRVTCPYGSDQRRLQTSSSNPIKFIGCQCQPGTSCLDETTVVVCPFGNYNKDPYGSDCRLCEPGTYTNQEASPACDNCLAGTYNGERGSTSIEACLSCEVGMFCPRSGMTVALPCSTGEFSNTSNSRMCDRCVPGFYADTTSSTSCKPCPVGHSCPGYGEVQPTACPRGSIAIAQESTNCEHCEAGTFNRDRGQSECTPCSVGHFCDGYLRVDEQRCLRGTFSEAANAIECLRCAEGNYTDDLGAVACQKCPDDRPFSTVERSGCTSAPVTACAQGFWCSDGDKTRCPVGTTTGVAGGETQDDCIFCPPGYTIDASQTACKPCPSGQVNPVENGTCMECSQPDRCPPGSRFEVPLDLAQMLVLRPVSNDGLEPGDDSVMSYTERAKQTWVVTCVLTILITLVVLVVLSSRIPPFLWCVDVLRLQHRINDGEPVIRKKTALGTAFSISSYMVMALLVGMLVQLNAPFNTIDLKPLEDNHATVTGKLEMSIIVPGLRPEFGTDCEDSLLPKFETNQNVGFKSDTAGENWQTVIGVREVVGAGWDASGCAVTVVCEKCSVSLLNEVSFRIPASYQLFMAEVRTFIPDGITVPGYGTTLTDSWIIRPEPNRKMLGTVTHTSSIVKVFRRDDTITGVLKYSNWFKTASSNTDHLQEVPDDTFLDPTLDSDYRFVLRFELSDFATWNVWAEPWTTTQLVLLVLPALATVLKVVGLLFKFLEPAMVTLVLKYFSSKDQLEELEKKEQLEMTEPKGNQGVGEQLAGLQEAMELNDRRFADMQMQLDESRAKVESQAQALANLQRQGKI